MEEKKENKHFKATIKDTKALKCVMSSVAEIMDEGIFTVDDNGLRLNCTDGAMVCVLDLSCKKEAFETFEHDGNLEIGLNLVNFKKIIERFDGQATLECVGNSIKIYNGKMSYRIPLVETRGNEVPPVDKLEFKCEVELSSQIFKRILDNARIVGDSVIFKINKEGMIISSEEQYEDISEYRHSLDNSELSDISSMEPVSSRFSLDYLKKMMKEEVGETTRLYLASNHPLKLTTESNGLVMTWILAPRVEEQV